MTESVVLLQPAFILHTKNYRETSLIADVLTRDYGRLSILVKGAKNPKSKLSPLIRPFIPIVISFIGRSELKTLTHIEPVPSQNPTLNGLALFCGFYVNELTMSFLHTHDPHPEVFLLYQKTLNDLSAGSDQEKILRLFELDLLTYVGYGLQLDRDDKNCPVLPDQRYDFDIHSAPTLNAQGNISGSTLIALQSRSFKNATILSEAKKMMRSVINYHLNGRPLKSRKIISEIIKQIAI